MIKATLAEIKDLGMQVNRLEPTELVDHCLIVFETENGEKYNTYAMTKTCHGKSKLGRMIRSLLGRNLTAKDYVNDFFDASCLIGVTAYIELNEYNVVSKVSDVPL